MIGEPRLFDPGAGELPQSLQLVPTNGELIEIVAPLYLTGSVLDVTYGTGRWWTRFTPYPFYTHDLAVDGVDFRDLPERDRSIETVCFDPPYIQRGKTVVGSAIYRDWRVRYGLTGEDEKNLWPGLIAPGLAEAQRVADRWVLAKCCDYTKAAHGLELGHQKMLDLADELGMRLHDLIVHATGPGPGGHQIFKIKRCRRAHSYLLVFEAHP